MFSLANIFPFWRASKSSQPQVKALTNDQRAEYKELRQQVDPEEFADSIIGFESEAKRLFEWLLMWKVKHCNSVVVISGSKQEAKKEMTEHVVDLWGKIHTTPVSANIVDFAPYRDKRDAEIVETHITENGVLVLINVNPRAPFVPVVFEVVKQNMRNNALLCIVRLVDEYIPTDKQAELCGLSVTHWVNLTTPNAPLIEKKVQELWIPVASQYGLQHCLDEDELLHAAVSVENVCTYEHLFNVLAYLVEHKKSSKKQAASSPPPMKSRKTEGGVFKIVGEGNDNSVAGTNNIAANTTTTDSQNESTTTTDSQNETNIGINNGTAAPPALHSNELPSLTFGDIDAEFAQALPKGYKSFRSRKRSLSKFFVPPTLSEKAADSLQAIASFPPVQLAASASAGLVAKHLKGKQKDKRDQQKKAKEKHKEKKAEAEAE